MPQLVGWGAGGHFGVTVLYHKCGIDNIGNFHYTTITVIGFAGFVLFVYFRKIPRNDEYDSERQLHTR